MHLHHKRAVDRCAEIHVATLVARCNLAPVLSKHRHHRTQLGVNLTRHAADREPFTTLHVHPVVIASGRRKSPKHRRGR